MTCPRDGVGTLVRGQKFTLVRGLRPRTRVNFWPRTRVPIPSWGQVKGVPFQLLDFQNWSFVPGDESGFMECALLSPEICAQVTGMEPHPGQGYRGITHFAQCLAAVSKVVTEFAITFFWNGYPKGHHWEDTFTCLTFQFWCRWWCSDFLWKSSTFTDIINRCLDWTFSFRSLSWHITVWIGVVIHLKCENKQFIKARTVL